MYYVCAFVIHWEYKYTLTLLLFYTSGNKEDMNNRIKRSITKSCDTTVLAGMSYLIKIFDS